MKIEYYKQYLHLKNVGLRSSAKPYLQQFIDSFTSNNEKEKWTRQFLEVENYQYGDKIRYELYEEVVFPVLLSGYRSNDPWSFLWLARTAQNLYHSKHLHRQIDFKTGYRLLKECYSLDPRNAEVQKDLLSIEIQWLDYCIHEYPTGILYGNNGATIDECQEILSKIEFVRKLDLEETHKKFINEVRVKVVEYLTRISKKSTILE